MEISIWDYTENFSNQSKIGSGANKDQLQSDHTKTVSEYIIKLLLNIFIWL